MVDSEKMKLTVLLDNHPGPLCPGEHGLSFLIEADTSVLLDTGPSGLFLENAQRLHLDLSLIQDVVLSHGHHDHGNGLPFLQNKRLICHPGCFVPRFRKRDRSPVGLNFSLNLAQKRFNLVLSRTPFLISENIIFLGEIPRLNNFESQATNFILKDGSEDFLPDDSALAIKSEKGLMIISGCAHAGICNTIEYARKVTGLEKVFSVIGGFHLQKIDEVLDKTIDYLKQIQVQKVIPAHCVHDSVQAVLAQEFEAENFFSGAKITL